MKNIFTFILFTFIFLTGFSATYYADPINGSMANAGTSAAPWTTLELVLNTQSFTAGDVIVCRNGNHGFPKVNGINAGYVTIQAQAGHTPVCNRIYFGSTSSAHYWKVRGLTFEVENTASSPIRLVDIFANCDHITIENCDIQSSTAVSGWTRNDWRTKACSGIWARGSNHIIQNNNIRNIAIGLINDADGSFCQNNIIENFTIDGIRGNANDSQYTSNIIKNNIIVYTYAENHYDGFQAFTNDTIKNVIIRKNTIICTTDTTRAFRGSMQGMGCFDGFYQNWTVENNLIITDHWHGITLLGAINCRIINNTVIDNYLITPIDPNDTASNPAYGPAWIKIAAHKNGQPSSGNIINNNICNDLQISSGMGTTSNNLVIPQNTYASHFINAPALDFHLIASSAAIDGGTTTLAPSTDLDGISRPQGAGIDIGAFEKTSGGCSVSVTISSTGNNICADETVTLTSSGNNTSVTWNNGISEGIAFAPTSSGYYVATAVNGACSTQDSVFIDVTNVQLVVSASNSSICTGESVMVSATGNYASVSWNNGVTNSVNFSPATTNYYVATAIDGSCSISDSVQVQVSNAQVTASTTNSTICAGDQITLTGLNASGNLSWNNGVSNGQSFAPSSSGFYVVTATSGNCTAIDSIYIDVVTLQLSLTTTDNEVCAGETTSVTASGNFSTVTWNNGISSGVPFTPISSDYYTATAVGGVCNVSDSIYITVNTLPNLFFNINDTTLCYGDSLNINLASSISPTGGTFSGVELLNNFIHGLSIGNNNLITYSYTDNNTCTASATDSILITNCFNAITENELSQDVLIKYSLNTITLEFETIPSHYNVYDISGKLIKTIKSPVSNLIRIRKNTLPKGMYFIATSFDGYLITSKVIIE